MYHTNKLIDLLNKFYSSHFKQDNDNAIKAIPIKIRQQVYGMLGEFGFSEIYENKKNQYVHPFISSTVLELNKLMAGYRCIEDDTKRKNVENMSENLIKDIIRIFKFRLLVQEPKYEVHWYENNVKIDTQFMKGQWDDDCLDNYVVDICYFPLIGMELNGDLSKAKVFMCAKVFPQCIAPPLPSRRKKREPSMKHPDETDEARRTIRATITYSI
ncbi:1256_t:CDS:2 [Entrophospora sp. SA101]|nr:1256_t:CDS:2 [Entrophospora sp. SA101]